jgi:hypothetical protein
MKNVGHVCNVTAHNMGLSCCKHDHDLRNLFLSQRADMKILSICLSVLRAAIRS